MKLTPLQKRAARKGRNGSMVDMNLVSLIDVFTILIFFLLSSAGVETLSSTKALTPPLSTAERAPRPTAVLVVATDEILLEGRHVATVAEALADGGAEIAPLKAALAALPRHDAVTILGDRTIPYRLLRKVMATSAAAGFADVSFAVRRKDGL
jgi:biopolymer transport protein ExbD